MRVVCVGDRFISAASFAHAAKEAFGPDTETVEYSTRWPDEAYGAVEGVKESSGSVDEIAELMPGADVLLTHLGPVTATVLARADRLKVVGITRGGPVNVDLAAATAHHVPVVYLPGRNLGAVAEFVIGVMITMPRGVVRGSAELVHGRWSPRAFRYETAGPELRACTVGLVGIGAVGRRVAQLLDAFGARVVAYDPHVDRADGIELLDSLEAVLSVSDIVSVHSRLTDETRKSFDSKAFGAMKHGAYFVNTARGEIVDEAALLEALDSGLLSGAALDVFDPEPPGPDNPLVHRPDVIGTPHLAGASRQVSSESVQRVVRDVASYLHSGRMDHCANPDALKEGS
ncbi:NAD(P)-dependent oxidoreductase [Allobranchiibius sp. GilTou73]|uniref:NAD(P)-dependent oxidoreductase n=1 Tax=Allobranchiibius sp. GilTou73 TaxID=2904523 RepID=UPI001F3A77A0|nr:NAD(P)-dependent oxidoreductase [Allobranchiibius sp. GilTou73]UIJ34913.1 hydroxyacid dehydrogenase [Allobranchiibius sp. GilTou73]